MPYILMEYPKDNPSIIPSRGYLFIYCKDLSGQMAKLNAGSLPYKRQSSMPAQTGAEEKIST